MPHNLIKGKLATSKLIQQTLYRDGSLYLACNEKHAFFTSEQPNRFKLSSCQKVCDAFHYHRTRDIVGIPMGTKHAPLMADLFLFCYERDFLVSLSDNNQTRVF